jgi:hypothetical protein
MRDLDPIRKQPGQNLRGRTGTYKGEGADAGVGARSERHGDGGAGQLDLSRRGFGGVGRGEGLRRLCRRGEEEVVAGWALYGPLTRTRGRGVLRPWELCWYAGAGPTCH